MNVSLSEVVAGGFDRYDGSIQFYQRINALLRPDFVVMDFGAGRGVNHIEDPVAYRRNLSNFKGKVKEVIGVDVDSAVTTNPATRPRHRHFRPRDSIAGSVRRFDPVGFYVRAFGRSGGDRAKL
jgi:hypothetical protein